MTGEPTVSVVIPVFNRAHLVGTAIHSALVQTLSSIEVVVVDDGSTNSIVHLMTHFAGDDRLRLVRKPNGGVSSARNHGIDKSRGTRCFPKFRRHLGTDEAGATASGREGASAARPRARDNPEHNSLGRVLQGSSGATYAAGGKRGRTSMLEMALPSRVHCFCPARSRKRSGSMRGWPSSRITCSSLRCLRLAHT